MLATGVGSYPRIGDNREAQKLRRAIAQFEQGKISETELRAVEDQVTEEVIHEQAEAGLDVVTDGQVRWDDPQSCFARRLAGFQIDGLVRYFDTNTYYRQPVAVGPVAWQRPIVLQDYQFASSVSPRPVKAVLTGPYTLCRLSRTERHTDFKTFLMQVAEALNREALALQEAGAPIIQFDEPSIVRHPEDFHLFAEATSTLAAGLFCTTELCTYFGDVRAMAPSFWQLPFKVFGLDFVMGTANYAALASFPVDKQLGLGIVDARNTRLETVEQIVDAIRRATSLVDPDRIHVNPSCGLEFLPRETAFRKLRRMVEGVARAREVLE